MKTVLERTMSESQLHGMWLSIKKGRELARQHPEIADEVRRRIDEKIYLEGELAKKYCPDDWEMSEDVGRNIISYALVDLLTEEELEQFRKTRRKISGEIGGSIAGRKCYENKTKIFGMAEKKAKKARELGGKRGGAIAGRENYEAGIGMWGLDEEEWREARRKAIWNRGLIPYDDIKKETEFGELSEKEYIIRLIESGDDREETREKVNSVFESNRTRAQINALYSCWKRRKIADES